MKKTNIFSAILMMCLMLVSSVVFTACSEEDLNTDQYQQGVHLNVYGPTPVMRGGQLRFLGSNLDQVAQVIIPGVDPITNIEVVKAGVPSEIRITVPHDGPEPGLVTLITRTDERIQTITPLNYTEPIIIEGFSPAGAMPGENVTITGDYLNLMHAVGFADDVLVGEEAFIEHDRYHIVVTVPEEARTGKLSLYDLDITALEDPNADVTYNIMETEEAFIVGTPTIAKLASPRGEANALGTITAKLGETITITGANFQLVESLTFGDADSELGEMAGFMGFTASKDGKTLTFVLPAEAPDGDINIICKSGVPVPVGKLVTVAPTELAAAPAPVKAGNSLTITGNDLDVVVKLQFPNCEPQDVTVEEGKIVVEVPATAQEGDIQLIMANGKKTPVAFTLVKPEATGFNMNPAAAGGAVEIQGTNLDLVKELTFVDGIKVSKFTVSPDGTVLTVTIPLKAETGVITLGLENGTTVATPELEVSKPIFCYITDATILTENELHAGDLLLVEVENTDVLTGVQIDGENCQYINKGDRLYINIPDEAGKNSVLKLISSNGEVEYTLSVIPNTEKTFVVWSGIFDEGDWTNWEVGKGTHGDNNPNMFKEIELAAGDIIRVHVTPRTDEWWQIQFFDGKWNKLTYLRNLLGIEGDHGDDGCNFNKGNMDISAGYLEIPVNAQLAADLTSDSKLEWGCCWIIQCQNLIVSKIEVIRHISLETTLWEGSFDEGDWTNWEFGKGTHGDDNPNLFVEAGLKAGKTIRVYVTPRTDEWWQIQFFDGKWNKLTYLRNMVGIEGDHGDDGCNFNKGNIDISGGYVELPVNAQLAEDLTSPTKLEWGCCWIIQCQNLVVTKITVE